jgi:hypothetical protein
MPVPFAFSAATSAIPLSQLDTNFDTTITLGNTAIQLGNTVTTLNNMTLANVTISSGNVTITNVTVTTANVTTVNATTVIATTANVTTANVATSIVTGSETLSYGTVNGVAYLNGSKVLTTGSALTFDGTNLGLSSSSVAAVVKIDGSGRYKQFEAYQSGAREFYVGYDSTDLVARIFNDNNRPITFGVSGSEQMRLDSTGLGIGTSSPTVKLDITGNDRLIRLNATSNNALMRYSLSGTAKFSQGLNDPVGWILFDDVASAYRLVVDYSGNLGLGVTPSAWFASSKAFQFGTAGVIEGRVGAAVAQFGCNWYIDSAGTYKYTTTAEATRYSSTSGQHAWHTAASGTAGNTISWTQAMTLDADGDLGIGTTSPATKLHVNSAAIDEVARFEGTGDPYISVYDSGTRQLYFGSVGASDIDFWVETNKNLRFATNNTERARITSGGYSKFSNDGTYVNAAGSYHEFRSNEATNFCVDIGSTSASFTAGGVVLIRANRNTTNNTFYALSYYNDAAGAFKFRVADSGDVTNTNGTYGTISDAKMKADIVDAGSQWADIKALRFRKFKMKDDPSGLVQLGVVAQEVELTSPGLVDEHQDRDAEGNDLGTTTKSVKTSVLLMKAAVALQEAMSRIEALEAQVAQLKGA